MPNIQFYAALMAAIDGTLQKQQQAVSVWQGLDKGTWKNIVEIQWAVPTNGFEFDGRPHIGTDREFNIVVMAVPGNRLYEAPVELTQEWTNANPILAHWRMKLRSFGCAQNAKEGTTASAMFECDAKI